MKEYGLIIKIVVCFIAGVLLGEKMDSSTIQIVNSVKFILSQIIGFVVPLIILGFIAPAITKLKDNANKMLGTMIILAYSSSVGAAFFSMMVGYKVFSIMNIEKAAKITEKVIPKNIFPLKIPPVFSVMTALVLALFLGLAIVWTKSKKLEAALDELNNVVLAIVNRIVIPILPIFIFTTMTILSYKGEIKAQLPIFAKIVVMVLIGHFIWLFFLYSLAGIISRKNPLRVLKHYGPAYLTAVGTMSSAATLPVAIECAKKSDALDPEVRDFAIPLGSTVHLCGSVLTEVFFLMAINKMHFGHLPTISTMILFITLLGVFAVGAPGVPGGTVVASLGIITAILGFGDEQTGLMLTIFAIQDSFGTACNVTGDGALALILDGIFIKKR